MILDCPSCRSRFLVPDVKIPPQGRTVRCGSCAHQWHVEKPADGPSLVDDIYTDPVPEAEDIPAADADSMAATANVPAIHKRTIPLKPFKIAVPVMAAVWLILAFVTYFPSWHDAPVLRGIYGVFGVTTTEGLVFSDVHMERAETETKTRFILSGSIVNHAAVPRLVPAVYIALKDAENGVLWGRHYPVNVILKPGEVYPFRIVNVETSFAEKVATIVLDLGNSLELAMR